MITKLQHINHSSIYIFLSKDEHKKKKGSAIKIK